MPPSTISRRRTILFSLLVVCGFFLLLETGLRLAGFTYTRPSRQMWFAYPDPQTLHELWQPDPITLWRLKPDDQYPWFGPSAVSNRFGFRGSDPATRDKPTDTIRIFAVGDSVTFGAETDWPSMLRDRLQDNPPSGCATKRFEVINAGVPGWSSWQARRLIEAVLPPFDPDLILIQTGWNDHWLAHGPPDREQHLPDPSLQAANNIMNSLIIYQALAWGIDSLAGLAQPPEPERDHYRVSLDNFVKNHASAMAEAVPARSFALTAPIAKTKNVPDHLFQMGFITPGTDLVALHKRYREALPTALSPEALIDVATVIEAHPPSEVFADPGHDLIHLNARGNRLLAAHVDRVLHERGVYRDLCNPAKGG